MATTLAKAADGAAVGAARRPDRARLEVLRPARRGQQLVLDDITLDVAPGEFVTLLGASGCGKSTLLNLVAGLDRPVRRHHRRTGGPARP